MTEQSILVVEDDVGTSRLVGEILRCDGIEIEYASMAWMRWRRYATPYRISWYST